MTLTISHKLQTFVNRCFHIIINSRWPEVISNHNLWEKTSRSPYQQTLEKGNGSG
jgi:hypothetical protein